MPVCSIVTINYNGATELMDTLKSIARLTHDDVEVIVIDGASSDQSSKVIEDYSFLIDKLVSEPDNGIYDAMNKGIKLASGDYTIFMNSGDSFYDSSVLDKVPFGEADVIHGDAYSMQSRGKWNYNDALWKGMICSHQATFFRTELLKKFGFSDRYRIVADYELYVKLEHDGASFHKVNTPIASIDTSGVSFVSFEERTLERLEVCKTYYSEPHVYEYFRELLTKNNCAIPDEIREGN